MGGKKIAGETRPCEKICEEGRMRNEEKGFSWQIKAEKAAAAPSHHICCMVCFLFLNDLC